MVGLVGRSSVANFHFRPERDERDWLSLHVCRFYGYGGRTDGAAGLKLDAVSTGKLVSFETESCILGL